MKQLICESCCNYQTQVLLTSVCMFDFCTFLCWWLQSEEQGLDRMQALKMEASLFLRTEEKTAAAFRSEKQTPPQQSDGTLLLVQNCAAESDGGRAEV